MQKHFAAIMALLALPCLSVQADPEAGRPNDNTQGYDVPSSARNANPRTGICFSRRQRLRHERMTTRGRR